VNIVYNYRTPYCAEIMSIHTTVNRRKGMNKLNPEQSISATWSNGWHSFEFGRPLI
jgi:hypothetical protein